MCKFFHKLLECLHLDKLFISNNKIKKEINKMITPKRGLKNPYYFINNNTVYKIDFNQDKDKCGEHKVVYKTEEKELEKGKWYYNLNGDYVQATSNGTYQVKTDELKDDACSQIFPNFVVKYTDEEGTEVDVYYYLQDLIQDGDTFDGTKFIQKPGHGDSTNYIQSFQTQLNEELAKLVASGKTIEQIKKILPHYYFEPSANVEENKQIIMVGCKKVSVTYNGVEGITPISDSDIMDLVYNVANQTAIECANNVLEEYGLEINGDLIEKGDIIPQEPQILVKYPADHQTHNILKENAKDDVAQIRLENPGYNDRIHSYPDIPTTMALYPNGDIYYYLFNNNSVPSSLFEKVGGPNPIVFDMHTIEIFDGVNTIGDKAFKQCTNLTNVTMADSVKVIGEEAFQGSGLNADGTPIFNVTIGNGVTTIGKSAFEQSQLKSIVIPKSCSYIGETAFYRCSNLKSITVKATTPPTMGGTGVFVQIASDAKIYVPSESVEKYKTANGWSSYADKIEPIA